MADDTTTKSGSKGAAVPPKGGSPETTGELVEHDKAYETGWLGIRNNPHADEEYALTSGPESPGARDVEDE
jgi:hypothetical protein